MKIMIRYHKKTEKMGEGEINEQWGQREGERERERDGGGKKKITKQKLITRSSG